MAQFYEGDEVIVTSILAPRRPSDWRKAKIISSAFPKSKHGPQMFDVKFTDGTYGVFDEDHIRALPTNGEVA